MNINSIFNPTSIAIIGASTTVGSVGNDIVKNLIQHHFTGKIYPVNPKAERLYNLPCYPTVTDIPTVVDLAVIVVPAVVVPVVLEQAGEKGIKAAIIISAGFKEIGNADLENTISDIARRYDIALVGPNCLGVISTSVSMNASFATQMPNAGKIAFLSQSGALCTAVLDYSESMGIGFSKFVSMGNKAILKETDMLEYLAKDPETAVIAMYVEQLQNPQALIEIAKKLAKLPTPKPIILLKSGTTQAGAAASASHTGALAGSDTAYQALFDQAGIIRARSIGELFALIEVFSQNPLAKGSNVAIVTNAGGPGVLTSDAAITSGLTLAELNQQTIQTLTENLPPAANTHNPVDILGDAKADRYESSINTVLSDPGVDSLLVILTPQSTTEPEQTAQAIIEARQKFNKPIVVCFMGEPSVQQGITILTQSHIARTNFPEEAAYALAQLTEFSLRSSQKESSYQTFETLHSQSIKETFQHGTQTKFPEYQAVEILSRYGFDTLKMKLVNSPEEAQTATAEIGKPVVMKIMSPDILHKSDVGGVSLNVTTETAPTEYTDLIQRVSQNVPNAKIDGVLVVEMLDLKQGSEFILGASHDPALGTLLMIGYGGIYVEVFQDVAFGIPPLTEQDIDRMISSLKSSKILSGVRGQAPLDRNALKETISRMSQFLLNFPEIRELDINPLFVTKTGVKILDARIILSEKN